MSIIKNSDNTNSELNKVSKSSGKGIHKIPSKFTVMIIPDSSEDSRSTQIGYDRIVRFIAAGLAIFIILSGLIISMMVHNYNLKNSLIEADRSLSELKEINLRLGLTIESLNEQIEEDKKAFDKIEEEIDSRAYQARLREEEAALPMGTPIKGGAVITVEDPNAYNPLTASKGVIFSATSGAVVVATGSGVVEEITDDNFYSVRITINHGNGYKSYYHLPCEVEIEAGAKVERNDMLTALVSDGLVSYEISYNGDWIDPKDMIENGLE